VNTTEMDRLVNEHFGYEAADDVEGVLATFTDDAVHEMKGGPLGPLQGKAALRGFYDGLFPDLKGEGVEPVMRLYGDDFLIDETIWTGAIRDARSFSLPGKSGHASFRLLHVFQLHDGLIAHENVWWDQKALSSQLS
jgi:ketosteroid isomerase-like protein